MIPAPFQVVLDANVLFPYTLRDTLLRAAEQDLYLIGWSAHILEEMRRNIVMGGFTTDEKSHALVRAMQEAFPEAEITGYEFLVDSMPNNPGDRHVAAAAVHAGAQFIITENTRHFRKLPEGLEAKTADGFLCDLLHLAPSLMRDALLDQAAAMRNPPRTLDDLLRGLNRFVPSFVESVRPLF